MCRLVFGPQVHLISVNLGGRVTKVRGNVSDLVGSFSIVEGLFLPGGNREVVSSFSKIYLGE